jgi:lipopolysaccharide export LptBFGC system permease protein LptF
MIQDFYEYKADIFDIIWEMITHVAYFIVYMIMLIVGLYLLALAQRDSSLGYAFSGSTIIALVVYQLFSGGRRLASEIYAGFRNSKNH